MSSKPVVPATTNPELEAESEVAKPKRRLYTPKPKQIDVIGRHLNGESDRKIAREENIDRGTVVRILRQEEALAFGN
jgi:CENP-B N-terminal DNA-binding domain